MAEHSFQVPMPNSPLLGAQFFAEVKVNHRSVHSCVLAKVYAVAVATGLVKIGFCLFKKNPVVRFFSSFAYYELTLNPFFQQCSDKIFT